VEVRVSGQCVYAVVPDDSVISVIQEVKVLPCPPNPPAGGGGETNIPQTPPCPGGVAGAPPLQSPTLRAASPEAGAAFVCSPPLDSPHHSSPFPAIPPHSRHPFRLPNSGAFPCVFPYPSPAPLISQSTPRHSLHRWGTKPTVSQVGQIRWDAWSSALGWPSLISAHLH
jgi:hypothetical protein